MPGLLNSNDHNVIRVNVVPQNSTNGCLFVLRSQTILRKLMIAYGKHKNIPVDRLTFKYDGQVIDENDTPTSLNIQHGDTIEVCEPVWRMYLVARS